MTFGGDEGVVCFELPAGQSMLTQDVAAAPSHAPVTLRALELSGGSGIALVESFVTAESSGALTTGAARYVPGDPRWRDRTPLSGAVVQPGQSVNVTAVLRREGPDPGRAAALTLTYDTAGLVYRRANTTAYVLDTRCG